MSISDWQENTWVNPPLALRIVTNLITIYLNSIEIETGWLHCASVMEEERT